MSFITKADLGTVIYNEKIDIITRGEDSLVTEAIDTAINLAEGYLSRYDHAAIFATTLPAERIKFSALISFIKDIAIWHLIKICNAGVDLELAKECHDDAIKGLMAIQGGRVSYSNWPTVSADVELNQSFNVTSNLKRSNYL